MLEDRRQQVIRVLIELLRKMVRLEKQIDLVRQLKVLFQMIMDQMLKEILPKNTKNKLH